MNIKKQIRKIGTPVTLDYSSTEKKFLVTSNTTTCSSTSLKKAFRELKKLVNQKPVPKIKKAKRNSDKIS